MEYEIVIRLGHRLGTGFAEVVQEAVVPAPKNANASRQLEIEVVRRPRTESHVLVVAPLPLWPDT